MAEALNKGSRLLYFVEFYGSEHSRLSVLAEHAHITGSRLMQDISDVLEIPLTPDRRLILDQDPKELLKEYLKQRYGDENFCALKDKREAWREQGL
jgi:hypothetical protein